jgi:hypothetical protein
LYISIACFGAIGCDTYGEQSVVVLYEVETALDGAGKLLFTKYDMVTRGYEHCGLGIESAHMIGCPCYAGSCVASLTFKQDVTMRHIGELLIGKIGILLVGNYKYVFAGQQAGYAVVGHLQQRAPHPEEVEKLLGARSATERPKTTAYTSAHNDTIAVFHVLS